MTTTTYPDDFLRQYVYSDVWCSPEQDSQRVFNPERITPNEGVWNNFLVGWRRYDLPTKTDRYHVYHIGQVFPDLIGLIGKQRNWFSMRYLCEKLNAFCDVYVENGFVFPRDQAHYMVTEEKLLVVAVKVPDRRMIDVDLVTEKIYLRVYRNKFFYTAEANTAALDIECASKVAASNQDIMTMQDRIDVLAAKPGGVLSYVNGKLVKRVNLLTAVPGDSIGYIYDPSIKYQLTFKVSDLYSFVSEVDQDHKYLLHHASGGQAVDYYDDVDAYVLDGPESSQYHGLYYHKNTENRLRNVTHRDYVIEAQGVVNLYPHFATQLLHSAAHIHLVVRDGSTNRVLVNEAHRIKDLYRMSNTDVYRSMIGIDANVAAWNVAKLEKSKYMKVMGALYGTITKQDAFDALGYNAASVLLGDTPKRVRTVSSQKLVDVPIGLQKSCTAYEYDADGKLLGWQNHTNNATYVTQYPTADLVELIFGQGTTSFENIVGQSTTQLDKSLNYRFYLATKDGGVVQNDWRDVSGQSNYHVFDTGIVQWAVNPTTEQQLVRSNKRHLVYQFEHPMEDGNIQFNVSQWNAANSSWETLKIPPARIDIFLNDNSLIEDVDYVVRWPAIYVISKEHIVNPGQPQKIVVRATGFCTNQMARIDIGDSGFVKHGVLSENNTYDIRYDKVNRIVVGGALYRHDELRYAESDGTVRVEDALNGKPYMITDILVPMNDFSEAVISNVDPTLTARAVARVTDKTISDYLSTKLPERDLTTPSTFVAKYQLFSPFFTKLFAALDTGLITGEWMHNHYGEQKVKDVCAQFEYLLQWDPLIDANAVDPTFTTIHPHPFDEVLILTPYQYKFINMAVKVYGRGKINLSSHAVISVP